jgi:hypothetical protein
MFNTSNSRIFLMKTVTKLHLGIAWYGTRKNFKKWLLIRDEFD